MGSAGPRLIRPVSPADWIEGRRLVEEYIASLGMDLSFQDLGRELDELSVEYGPPAGEFLLAEIDGVRVGCAGLRRFNDGVGEMKRLYTVPAVRGRGVGRLLAQGVVAAARERGYGRLVLDTLPLMAEAQALYRSMGFRTMAPYRFNPIAGTTFLELELLSGDGPEYLTDSR